MKKRIIMKKVKELIKEIQADSFVRGIDWRGYAVYVPVYNEEVFVGMPIVVLKKGKVVRFSTPEESLEYLDYELRNNSKNTSTVEY